MVAAGAAARKPSDGHCEVWRNPTTRKETTSPYDSAKDIGPGLPSRIVEQLGIDRETFYDPLPLEARAERRVEGGEWIRERVSFTAACGGERVIAQVFLPVGVRPPYQVVVYFPGTTAVTAGPSDSYDTDHFIPRTALMKESLAWLDEYLGPVTR